MGTKYYIFAKLNGYCCEGLAQDSKNTNYLIIALFWLIRFRIKYPIVDLQVRNGYSKCDYCKYEGLLCYHKFKDE